MTKPQITNNFCRLIHDSGYSRFALWCLIIFDLIWGFSASVKHALDVNDPSNLWTVGEWLINYSGGFVRRGLFGSLLQYLYVNYSVNPWNFAIIVSSFSWLVLSLCLVLTCWRRISMLLVFSSFCMLSPLIGGYVIRKDCLNLVILYAALIALRKVIVLAKAHRYDIQFCLLLFLVMSLSIAGCLSHEVFLFYYGPSVLLFVHWSTIRNESIDMSKKLVLACAVLLPATLAAVISSTYHGDADVAQDIASSWQPIILGSNLFRVPGGAIEAIQWNFKTAFSYTDQYILKSPIKVSFLLLSTAINYVLITAKCFFNKNLHRLRSRVGISFLTLTACMAPVFIVGLDYGRWLFIISISSLLVASTLTSAKCLDIPDINCCLVSVDPYGVSTGTKHIIAFTFLFWGIPAYWISFNMDSLIAASLVSKPVAMLSHFGIPGEVSYFSLMAIYIFAAAGGKPAIRLE